MQQYTENMQQIYAGIYIDTQKYNSREESAITSMMDFMMRPAALTMAREGC